MKTKILLVLTALAFCFAMSAQQKPLRIGVVGLTHDHIHGLLGRKDKGEIEIVGIAEPNIELARKYANIYGLDMKKVCSSIDEMLYKTHPEAVMAYNDIFGHLEVVEKCAPKGIHVMVEKPLAVSVKHAERMRSLAKRYNIHLLTNYETSWYPSTNNAYELANSENSIGEIRKIMFQTGHQGPMEIGCSKEFLSWLTDPVLNGSGALYDFGCYGANISSWLMKGEYPVSVTAVTHTNKPHIYPKVDDEATIIIQYPKSQVVIQASWNWPYNRKDMQIYGKSGFVNCSNANDMMILKTGSNKLQTLSAPPLPNDRRDAFSYFLNVVRGNIIPQPNDLSALENNVTTVKILEAAKKSAEIGKTVHWNSNPKDN